MNKLNNKGFIGSVAFSKEDKVFFGKHQRTRQL